MEKRLVLIADDSESIRELYTVALNLADIDSIIATDGQQAVTLALQKHPDVILS
jgi:DNA-binding response OmpR family regulator